MHRSNTEHLYQVLSRTLNKWKSRVNKLWRYFVGHRKTWTTTLLIILIMVVLLFTSQVCHRMSERKQVFLFFWCLVFWCHTVWDSDTLWPSSKSTCGQKPFLPQPLFFYNNNKYFYRMLHLLFIELCYNCTHISVLGIEICGYDGGGTRADDCDETDWPLGETQAAATSSRLSTWGSMKHSKHKAKSTNNLQQHCSILMICPKCRCTCWWSSAGTLHQPSVRHSIPWQSLWRKFVVDTRNLLCGLLRLTDHVYNI